MFLVTSLPSYSVLEEQMHRPADGGGQSQTQHADEYELEGFGSVAHAIKIAIRGPVFSD
jgi:hypothetical protein